MSARVRTYSGDMKDFLTHFESVVLAGVTTDSVEWSRLARTVQGPASNGFLPLIATGP